MNTVTVKEEYAVLGSGKKVLVMIPGLSLKGTLPLAEQIAAAYLPDFQDYRIYLFDSRKTCEGYTLRRRADEIAEIMNEQDIKDAYVFGASMGGMVGQMLAAGYPKLVKKAVFASTAAFPCEESKKLLQKWKEAAEKKDTRKLAFEMTEAMYSAETVKSCGEAIASSVGTVTDEELQVFLHFLSAIEHFDSREDLAKIKCPVFVIGCEGDRVFYPKASEFLAEKLKCSLYMYKSEYGHSVYDEAPDYKARMLKFFEKEA